MQEELGLNMTAMDYRQYDSAIGRFVGMDVLSESSSSVTPYHFGFNNPVFWADPSGLVSQAFIDRIKGSANGTVWTNNGIGFNSGDQNIDYDGYETLPAIFIQATKSRRTGDILGFKSDNLIGGFKYGLAEKARDQAYHFGSAYQSRREGIETRQVDEFQDELAAIGVADPTFFADGLNALIYLGRGQKGNAGIAAIGMFPYAGDLVKGGKYLGKTDNVAGTAFKPSSGTAKALGDGIPNSSYERLAPNGNPISKHFYNDAGQIKFEINYKPHGMGGVHGHNMSTPGSIISGHQPQNHIPFMLIPKKYL